MDNHPGNFPPGFDWERATDREWCQRAEYWARIAIDRVSDMSSEHKSVVQSNRFLQGRLEQLEEEQKALWEIVNMLSQVIAGDDPTSS